MAATRNCESCSDLQENSSEFVVNGVTENVCTSLKNNMGFNASSGHDDCTDLEYANDCLIGNMEDEVDAYEVCDWKEFMTTFIHNLWSVLKAIICAICGIWTHLDLISYVGILTLYSSEKVVYSGDTSEGAAQVPAFNEDVLQGNIDEGILVKKDDYKGITINNTTSVPLLVETTFNCSITTEQRIACCYLVVTRDGQSVGQTPFITPDTYDQQVTAEPFILQPGETAEMGYYFAVGNYNSWYQSQFGYKTGGTGTASATLDAHNGEGIRVQGSYFTVRVTSIVSM